MKKFLIKMTVYGLISFIVLNLISFMCLYFLGNSVFYKQQFIKNGVKERQFDYVILGSSTGLTTLDTKQIDSTTAKNGLNISIDDSGLSSHYLMLQHFYSSGKKTKTLILSVMPDDLENANPTLNGNDYRFLPHIWNSEVQQYFNEIEGENKKIYQLSNYFPLVGVSYFNTELFYPAILSIQNPKKRNLFDDKGNYSYPRTNSSDKLKNTKNFTKIVTYKNPYLNKIIDFCANNKITLILYQSPIYQSNVVFPKTIEVINHSNIFSKPDMFFDKVHVNSYGRSLCSASFSQFLMNYK